MATTKEETAAAIGTATVIETLAMAIKVSKAFKEGVPTMAGAATAIKARIAIWKGTATMATRAFRKDSATSFKKGRNIFRSMVI